MFDSLGNIYVSQKSCNEIKMFILDFFSDEKTESL